MNRVSLLWMWQLCDKNQPLPWHIRPSNPASQIQIPVVSSQIPLNEHFPSPGQLDSMIQTKDQDKLCSFMQL